MISSPSDLTAALKARAALGDVWNADRETPANRDLTEERFHRADFRDGRIRKRAQIILKAGKIHYQVRTPHGYNRHLRSGVIRQLTEQNRRCIRNCRGGLRAAGCWSNT